MGSVCNYIDRATGVRHTVDPRAAQAESPVRTANADGVYYDVVAVASSAGGLRALATVLAAIPESFPAPLVIVQHLDPSHVSLMAAILGRRTELQVVQSVDGQVPVAGTAYIAPPDYHLRVGSDGALEHSQTPPVHYVRPSADVLFESVAAHYAERAIAVVLTGAGSDGSDGIVAVKQAGGTTLIQDPETAEYSAMPCAALATHCVDHVLPLEKIGPALVSLVTRGEIV